MYLYHVVVSVALREGRTTRVHPSAEPPKTQRRDANGVPPHRPDVMPRAIARG
jgi:hypothetical protein